MRNSRDISEKSEPRDQFFTFFSKIVLLGKDMIFPVKPWIPYSSMLVKSGVMWYTLPWVPSNSMKSPSWYHELEPTANQPIKE